MATEPTAVVRAVRDVGFPIVVALLLIWALVFRAPTDVERLATSIDRNTSEVSRHLANLESNQVRLIESIAHLLERLNR